MYYVAQIAHEGDQTTIDFPDCPGCQTFADPGEDVETVAREALEGWLAEQLEGGGVPPRPELHEEDASALAVRIVPSLAIALQVRWQRLALNLSQAQLGKLLGVSRQQAASLENPDANLRMSTLERAAEALHLDLDVALSPR